MPPYSKNEARAWAWETMRGVTNVILPSFTPDFSGIDEAAVRHDVRRNIEFNFWGALCIPEPAMSLDEYLDVVRYSADEAGDRLQLMHYASFDSFEQSVEATQAAAEAGAVATLLSYPPGFHPLSSEDIYDYTRRFCDATDLGVVLFPVPLWGFERVHGAGIDPHVIARLVDDCPSLIGVKSEGGYPSISGFVHTHQLVGDKVLVTTPIESQTIPLRQLGVPLQWQAPSHSEIYGGLTPEMWRLLDEGENEKAWEIYWRLQPARSMHPIVSIGGNLINWWAWKYIGWLNGMNGGPLRLPTQRLDPGQMVLARRALEASGVPVTSDPDELFFVGRSAAGQLDAPVGAASGAA